MISHQHKCIFIHIPKTAGTSINEFFHPGVKFKVSPPDYDRIFGWCPKRKLHMQHATSKQLIETGLIKQEHWDEYFKFTFVRNPWDRAYSDYIWLQKYSGVKGSFRSYINKSDEFEAILNDNSNSNFLGDHLQSQTSFFDIKGDYELDFVGRFENFEEDIKKVLQKASIEKSFNIHENKGKRYVHYSNFYTNSYKKWVAKEFNEDIDILNYKFENKRIGKNILKRLL